MTRSKPLVIIGGGPAGMAAAIEAARAGLPCTLIDEAPQLGGQIYRKPSPAFKVNDAGALGKDFARGECVRAEFAEVAGRVEVLSGTSALGVWDGREVLWASDGASGVLRAERLILAAGAYDRPVPFPGWTLPGVMTAGGVNVLIKTMQIRPGRRALVAGTSPLLVGVANRLREAGVEVVCILEAGNPWWSGPFPEGWGEWEFMKDALEHRQALQGAGIPVLANHTIFEAQGQCQVEKASYGPVDPEDWRPLKGKAQTVEVDLVVVGFGFVPNTELTDLAGCRHQYVAQAGGWVPVRDALMQTSVPGVFAAGDGAGIGGAAAALEEGRIAGITAAEQAGFIPASEAAKHREGPLARLGSLRRLRAVLDETSRVRPGLLELAGSETQLCRCEEVTLAEVRAAIAEGARDLQAVKLLTRLGMGPCQGRNCAPSTGMYLCHARGCALEDIGRINPRPPVKPVTLGVLARTEGAVGASVVDPLDAVGGGS